MPRVITCILCPAGFDTGLSLAIAYMVLPPYFSKSGMANTFLVAGRPVTQMVLAPLLRYLLAMYSFRGAALIYGAIILNGLIAMSFFHPVKWHLKPSSGEMLRLQQEGLRALKLCENTPLTAAAPDEAEKPPPRRIRGVDVL